jgi:hypothetical protein
VYREQRRLVLQRSFEFFICFFRDALLDIETFDSHFTLFPEKDGLRICGLETSPDGLGIPMQGSLRIHDCLPFFGRDDARNWRLRNGRAGNLGHGKLNAEDAASFVNSPIALCSSAVRRQQKTSFKLTSKALRCKCDVYPVFRILCPQFLKQ